MRLGSSGQKPALRTYSFQVEMFFFLRPSGVLTYLAALFEAYGALYCRHTELCDEQLQIGHVQLAQIAADRRDVQPRFALVCGWACQSN